jgi:hypothetical protein
LFTFGLYNTHVTYLLSLKRTYTRPELRKPGWPGTDDVATSVALTFINFHPSFNKSDRLAFTNFHTVRLSVLAYAELDANDEIKM